VAAEYNLLENVDENENTRLKIKFEHWGEFLNFAINRTERINYDNYYHQQAQSRATGREAEKFAETKTFEEAVKLATEGWQEGLDKAKNFTASLYNRLSQVIEKPEVLFDVTGNDYDIALVNQGVPECWMYTETHEEEGSGGKKFIHIVFNVSASGGVSSGVLINRGAAVAALVDLFEAAGRAVILDIVDTSGFHKQKKRYIYEAHIRVKNADQPLDLGRVIFGMAHPSMLRRLMFSVQEGIKEVMPFTPGYGSVEEIEEHEQGDIYLAGAMWGQSQWDTPESAKAWILKQLTEQGVPISEGAAV